jgi:CheY-like chemotaxis protein
MRVENPVVLIVDDNTSDILLLRTVFRRAGFVNPLQFASNGNEAIAYLQGTGEYADRTKHPLPTVVLLDLNMPGKNGFEMLQWIHRQPPFRQLRVYILSASSRPEDIERAYDLGANSYLVKPRNLDGLVQLAECLIAWLRISQFTPLHEESEQMQPALARSLGPPGEFPEARRVG